MGWLGIDFGSFHTVAAVISDDGVVNVCTNDLSNRSTPTMVGLEGRRILVGEACETRMASNLAQSYTHLTDAIASMEAPRGACWAMTEGKVAVIFGGEEMVLSMSEIVAMYLRRIVAFGTLDKAVPKTIAVPDWYMPEQVSALDECVALADLGAVTYVRHSDALCAQYQGRVKEEGTEVLICDVGFGQSTAVLVRYSADNWEIVRRETIRVGGRDLIHTLVEMCLKKAPEALRSEVKEGSKAMYRLEQASHRALKQLSMLPDTEINIECWVQDEDLVCHVTKQALAEEACRPLQRLVELVREVKGDAASCVVEIMGGTSRSALVQEAIAEGAGAAVDALGKGLDSSSAIALGACVCAKQKLRTLESSEEASKVPPTAKKENVAKITVIDAAEVERLNAQNALESYVYQVKDWASGAQGALLNAKEVSPYLDDVLAWLEEQEMDTTAKEVYSAKLEETQAFVEKAGKAFFDDREAKKLKLEAELEELQRENAQKEKEDHDYRQLPKSERLRMAEKNRAEGNDLFQGGNFPEAIIRYQKAQAHLSKMFDLSPEEEKEKNRIGLSCYLNTAQCYLKAEVDQSDKDKAEAIYKKAKGACDEALRIDGNSIKALFRRATALEKIGLIDDAREDIAAGLKLDPENADFNRADARVARLQEIQKGKEKKMYGKMFG